MNKFSAELEKAIQNNSFPKTLKAGATLSKADSYVRAIPILLSGSLRVLRHDEEGREILLYYIKPGETCIMSFMAGVHHETTKVSAVVEEDAEIIMLPFAKASEWLRTYPEWSDYIFKLFNTRFDELLNTINAIAFQKLDDRIFDLLKKKSSVYQSNEINITHQQLADELATTREVISRLLKQMERQQIVTLSRNKITLNNRSVT